MFTPQEIARAEMLAARIEAQKSEAALGHIGIGVEGNNYADQRETKADVKVRSHDEALRYLKQMHTQKTIQQQSGRGQSQTVQRQQSHQQPRPVKRVQYSTPAMEIRAYSVLCSKYKQIQGLMARLGNPPSAVVTKYLRNLRNGLVGCLRMPAPDVRVPVTEFFRTCKWDIRANTEIPTNRPAQGTDLVQLLASLVDFFGKRHNRPTSTNYVMKKAPVRKGTRPVQHARGGRGGGANRGNVTSQRKKWANKGNQKVTSDSSEYQSQAEKDFACMEGKRARPVSWKR